jgi:hypothetical protein
MAESFLGIVILKITNTFLAMPGGSRMSRILRKKRRFSRAEEETRNKRNNTKQTKNT